MNKIFEIVEREEKKSLVYVCPSDDDLFTGMDSDKSVDEHEGNLNHLDRRMLHATADIQLVCNDDKIEEEISYVQNTPTTSQKKNYMTNNVVPEVKL
ncbi:hypothetical protein L9F63_004890 [Diploptera punctata]|uniref:Uncharacterized protein n=1 Tax=Diploptera punctata TaxID=6984 RepID=A0AAD8E6Q8_DIPPU|nr:hypothetical protein L9F63_004890 [Diploptera punctata]